MRTLLLLTILTLTSCQGFVYEKELIDNYYLVACDIDEQMSLDYNNDGGANYSGLIRATVFDVQWNERFIVIKTHPEDIRASIKDGYRNLHFKGGILDKKNTKGYFTQQEIDELHRIDSLAEKDVDEVLKSNTFLNANSKKKVVLYYLLDTKNQNQRPLLFLTENELKIALQKNVVGSLTHSQYFEDLDK